MNQKPLDQYINVGDIRTRYWKVGDYGPPVILVHGILRFVEDWLLNIEALAQNHQVYALDLVGHGCTDKPDMTYSMNELAEFLNDFMAALGIERATLIGHSLGGGVVLTQAYQRPEKVDHLVSVAGAGFGQKVHPIFQLASCTRLADLLARPTRIFIARAFKEVFYDPTIITPEMIDFAYAMFYRPGAREAFLQTVKAGLNWRGVRPEILAAIDAALPTITIPVLIIWGRQDKILPVRQARSALERLPKARLNLLDECGHFPMLEHPHVFNALVREFLTPDLPRERVPSPLVAAL